jgi:hypothetical protein
MNEEKSVDIKGSIITENDLSPEIVFSITKPNGAGLPSGELMTWNRTNNLLTVYP